MHVHGRGPGGIWLPLPSLRVGPSLGHGGALSKGGFDRQCSSSPLPLGRRRLSARVVLHASHPLYYVQSTVYYVRLQSTRYDRQLTCGIRCSLLCNLCLLLLFSPTSTVLPAVDSRALYSLLPTTHSSEAHDRLLPTRCATRSSHLLCTYPPPPRQTLLTSALQPRLTCISS